MGSSQWSSVCSDEYEQIKTHDKSDNEENVENAETDSEAESAVADLVTVPNKKATIPGEEFIMVTVVAKFAKGPSELWRDVQNVFQTYCGLYTTQHRVYTSAKGKVQTRIYLGKTMAMTSKRSKSLLADIVKVQSVERAFCQTRDMDLQVHHSESFLADHSGEPF